MTTNKPMLFTTEKVAKIVVVTPELAADWLTFNLHNRKVSAINASRIGQSIAADEFTFNGDAIRWSTDGALLDGQHRLGQVVETGRSIETVVVWGIAPTAGITIDRNKRRTLRDHLEIMREPHAKELATVLNLAAQWARGDRFNIGHQSGALLPSYEEAYTFLLENPSVRASVEFSRMPGARKIINPAHLATLHWIFAGIDPDDAEDFLTRVISGEHASVHQPEWRLRERLLDMRQNHVDRPWLVIPLACKAWNFYRAGEPVRYLRIRLGGSKPEAFPEPK